MYKVKYCYLTEEDRRLVKMNIISVELVEDNKFLINNIISNISLFHTEDIICYYINIHAAESDINNLHNAKFIKILINNVKNFIRDKNINILL